VLVPGATRVSGVGRGNRGPRFNRALVVRACNDLCKQEAESDLSFRDARDVQDWLARHGEITPLRTVQHRLALCVDEGLLVERTPGARSGGWESAN